MNRVWSPMRIGGAAAVLYFIYARRIRSFPRLALALFRFALGNIVHSVLRS